MKIPGTDDPAFQKAVGEAAEALMAVALPAPIQGRAADISCRMAASLGVIANTARRQMMGDVIPPSMGDVETFMRAFGGAVGMTCEQLPDPENSAVLAAHYMLDFMGRKDPAFRGRVTAKLALLYLEGAPADAPSGPLQ
jgi:hypothetical protein